MFRRLIRRKTPQNPVWGLRIPANIRIRWTEMARQMGVPTNQLIAFILRDWTKANLNTLTDKESRGQLAERIAKEHRDGTLGK